MGTIRQGDTCWVRLDSGKKHYGVCVEVDWQGQPSFVHNTTRHGVVKTDRRGFGGRRPIHVEAHAPPGAERDVAVRALGYVGQDYDLFRFNCEHLANKAQTGVARSGQLQQAVGLTSLLATLGAVALASQANANDTRVDRNGYRRNALGQFDRTRWW